MQLQPEKNKPSCTENDFFFISVILFSNSDRKKSFSESDARDRSKEMAPETLVRITETRLTNVWKAIIHEQAVKWRHWFLMKNDLFGYIE